MFRVRKLLRGSYLFALIALFYAPLLFAAVFSFNADPAKGSMSFRAFEAYSNEGWASLFDSTRADSHTDAIVNSILIAIPVAIITLAVALITVYALWRQKVRLYKLWVDGTSNVPLINPDIITAVSLVLTFGVLFGQLQFGDSGYFRAVVAHIVMILPFALTIMYPRSAKFPLSLMEASKDLGYGPFRTWMRTYFVHMAPVVVGAFVIAVALSLDDFIITRLTFSSPAIGKELYNARGGQVRAWSLAIGTGMLFLLAMGVFSFGVYRYARAWQLGTAKKLRWKVRSPWKS